MVNRGVERRDVFCDDVDRVEFGRLLGVVHDRFGVNVHAYCLMSNHYHLLLECPGGGLSDAMQLLGSVYVRHFNERVGRDGPLFRSRFFARSVATEAMVVAVARYIHRNPLAFMDPVELESYRWSSLRTYREYRRRSHWLRTDVVSALSDDVVGLGELTRVPGRPVGVFGVVDGAVLQHFVDVAVDEHLDDVGTQRVGRTVMALLLDHVEAPADETVRSLLAFPNAAAERAARSRARRRARDHPVFDLAVSAVLRSAA